MPSKRPLPGFLAKKTAVRAVFFFETFRAHLRTNTHSPIHLTILQ